MAAERTDNVAKKANSQMLECHRGLVFFVRTSVMEMPIICVVDITDLSEQTLDIFDVKGQIPPPTAGSFERF